MKLFLKMLALLMSCSSINALILQNAVPGWIEGEVTCNGRIEYQGALSGRSEVNLVHLDGQYCEITIKSAHGVGNPPVIKNWSLFQIDFNWEQNVAGKFVLHMSHVPGESKISFGPSTPTQLGVVVHEN